MVRNLIAKALLVTRPFRDVVIPCGNKGVQAHSAASGFPVAPPLGFCLVALELRSETGWAVGSGRGAQRGNNFKANAADRKLASNASIRARARLLTRLSS